MKSIERRIDMMGYDNLKNCYITAIQIGINSNTKYDEIRYANELLHKFCEQFIENSSYTDTDKQNIKRDLEIVKETLSGEIEEHWRNRR